MQKFLIKQGLCAAICITMAFTVCTCTAAAAYGGAGFSIVTEAGARAADSLKDGAQAKLNSAKAATRGLTGTAPAVFSVIKAEVTQAIIPEP